MLRDPCGRSSAGRASPCQGEGRGFKSRRPLNKAPGQAGSTGPAFPLPQLRCPSRSLGSASFISWLRRSAASWAPPSTKWLYTFRVVVDRAWPRRPATIETGTPPGWLNLTGARARRLEHWQPCSYMSTDDPMDEVFQALAHPVRRRMLDLVRANPGSPVGAVCEAFDMSRIGAMKHLRILEAVARDHQNRQTPRRDVPHGSAQHRSQARSELPNANAEREVHRTTRHTETNTRGALADERLTADPGKLPRSRRRLHAHACSAAPPGPSTAYPGCPAPRRPCAPSMPISGGTNPASRPEGLGDWRGSNHMRTSRAESRAVTRRGFGLLRHFVVVGGCSGRWSPKNASASLATAWWMERRSIVARSWQNRGRSALPASVGWARKV